ncbi:hypothetical protein WAI453_005576 [Rhynchosporium graminicola]
MCALWPHAPIIDSGYSHSLIRSAGTSSPGPEPIRKVLIVDPLLSPAHDILNDSSWKYAILGLCSVTPSLFPGEAWLAAFWKYPCCATGFPYPLP